MKARRLWILLIVCALLAGCAQQPGGDAAPADTSASPTADAAETTAADATPEPPDAALVAVEGYPWQLVAPLAWEGQIKAIPMTSENPVVEDLYALRYTPEEALPQDVNVGYLYVIPTDRWSGDSITLQDIYMVRIGEAGSYTIAYSGTRDNPLTADSEAGQAFASMMLFSNDAPGVLSIAE